MSDPFHDKLRKLMWDAFYPGEPMYPPDTNEIRSMYEKVDTAVLAITPEITKMIRDMWRAGYRRGRTEGLKGEFKAGDKE